MTRRGGPERRPAARAAAPRTPGSPDVPARPFPSARAALDLSDARARPRRRRPRPGARGARRGSASVGSAAPPRTAGPAASRPARSRSTPTCSERLDEGNRRYEERFGRVFLIRAAGRSAEEMLAALEQRLGHDDDTERDVVRRELAEIVRLRLLKVVADG